LDRASGTVENDRIAFDARDIRKYQGSLNWLTKEKDSRGILRNFEAQPDEYIIIKFLNGDLLHVRGPAEQLFLPELHADIMVQLFIFTK